MVFEEIPKAIGFLLRSRTSGIPNAGNRKPAGYSS